MVKCVSMRHPDKIRFIYILFTALFCACSNNLLSPIVYDMSDTEKSTNDTPTDTPPDTNTQSDTEIDTGTTTDTGTDSGPVADTGVDTEDDTGLDTGVDTGKDTGTDTGTGTGTESDTTADTGIDTDTGPPIDTGIDTGIVVDTETDTYVYQDHAIFSAVGFATVAGLNAGPVSGGEGAIPIVVTSVEEFQAAIENKANDPLIIHVSGVLDTPKTSIVVEGKQNISIIGLDNTAELDGVGITVIDCENIIVQNLTIHHVEEGDADAIMVSNSHHVWIDHCDIYNAGDDSGGYDGLVDIKNASDFVTVSWNKFRQNLNGLIIGHSNNNGDEDENALQVTYHHNYFEDISPGQLSCRFGHIHAFNNYFTYSKSDSTTGISSRMGACVRGELNRFEGVTVPFRTDQSGDTVEELGSLQLLKNDWGIENIPVLEPTCVFEDRYGGRMPYNYLHTVNSTDVLPEILASNSGVGII